LGDPEEVVSFALKKVFFLLFPLFHFPFPNVFELWSLCALRYLSVRLALASELRDRSIDYN
jgi:hypothetical protein